MARQLLLHCATAVVALAILCQYLGFSPRLFGVNLIPSWPIRRDDVGTINAAKLLADLNNDLVHSTHDAATREGHSPITQDSRGSGVDGASAPGSGSASGAGGSNGTARATSAALSVMYLATMPGLKDQVKMTPGIVESLLRHTARMDAAALRRSLLKHSEKQSRKQQQKHQEAELMAASVLALARLAEDDPQLGAWLLGSPGARPRPGGSQPPPEGALLLRLEELLRSGVPAWQAATCVLLHSLGSGPAGRPHAVAAWVAEREDELMQLGIGLMETGAHYNSTDVVLSGSQLLDLLASEARGWRKLVGSKAPGLALQLVVSHAGLNTSSSSSLVAGTARLLRRLAAGGHSAGTGGNSGDQQERVKLIRDLAVKGLVAPLVREVRVGQRASLSSSLALLADLVTAWDTTAAGAAAGGTAAGGPAPEGEEHVAAAAAVGSGILSLCSQLLFKADAEADAEPRQHCSSIVRHVSSLAAAQAGTESAAASAVASYGRVGIGGGESGKGNGAASSVGGGKDTHAAELEGLDDVDGTSGQDGSGKAHESRARLQAGSVTAYAVYAASQAGRAALAGDLLAIMSSTPHPDLHNAVVEALRDVAPARPAAEALVAAGAGSHLVALLRHNTTAEAERGADHADVAWLLQTQRSAAAVLALLALQGGPVRDRLAADGAVEALAAALAVHTGHPGLMGQVRVTAAAALVPMLGPDGRYDQAAMAAGVLEPLVVMHLRGGPQERQAAARVLRLLGRDPAVAAAYERSGLDL